MTEGRPLTWRTASKAKARTRLLREADAPEPLFLVGPIDRAAAAAATPAGSPPGAEPAAPSPIEEGWARLPPLTLDPAALDRARIITGRRRDPAYGSFDVLRTKLLSALAEQGWHRVGVTSPTKGCGKSFVAANLALTLARYRDCRTVLLDLDMRQPTVARKLGATAPGPIAGFLRGTVPPEAALMRVNPGLLRIQPWLAVGLNTEPEPFASELFYDPSTAEALARMDALLSPQVTLLDLPPVLAQDDVLAIAPHLDCVLIVAEGGRTTSRELVETSRRLGDSVPILAVVLNKAEGDDILDYRY